MGLRRRPSVAAVPRLRAGGGATLGDTCAPARAPRASVPESGPISDNLALMSTWIQTGPRQFRRPMWPAAGGVATLVSLVTVGALIAVLLKQSDGTAVQAGSAAVIGERSDTAIADLPADQQEALLDPLRRLAADLDAAGRLAAASYAGVVINAGSSAVTVYATGSAGSTLLATARAADPSADWSDVRVSPARFSKATLDSAAHRIIADPHRSAAVAAVAVDSDGGGLDVEVTDESTPELPVVGVPVRVDPGSRRVAKASAWGNVKWHDSSPFIGGDVLTNGHGYCTAGLPAVLRSNRHPVMITAGHCFAVGAQVHTGAGTAGVYSGLQGNLVGTVTSRVNEWDAAIVDGANNNADESDTTYWKPLTSAAYSYVGDFVCHDGQHSFYSGHPTPCGIKVTNGDLWFPISNYTARGVEGIDVSTGWGSINGDSGATIFAKTSTGLSARGVLSAGGADGTPDQRRVDWTEAPDIFAYYGLMLNPQQ